MEKKVSKKEQIIALHNEGKSVKEILKLVDVWDSYVRTTIKNYKTEEQVKNLSK